MLKNKMILIVVFFAAIFSVCALFRAEADGKKDVMLSTVDLKQSQEYEILGLVYYRSSELNPKKIHEELAKQAESMGADHVIGITYYNNAGYLYGSGTAVKLIKKDKKD